MAEELRRLKDEAAKPNQTSFWFKERNVFILVPMVGLIALLVVSAAYLILPPHDLDQGLIEIYHKRTTPCYFIEPTSPGEEPYGAYQLYRSPCEGCDNVHVSLPHHDWSFEGKDEAWKFILDHHLEACK